jgi:hypothetical protein
VAIASSATCSPCPAAYFKRPPRIDATAWSSTLAGGGKSGSPMERNVTFSPAAARAKPSTCTAHLAAPSPERRSDIGAKREGVFFTSKNYRLQQVEYEQFASIKKTGKNY